MIFEMIKKMKDEISYELSFILDEYKRNGRSETYYTGYNRVIGMIKMLSIVTGKEYYFDEKGLHERE